MSVQFGILARLTWWEYSWDIMEPVTYFVTYGTAMACYAYFLCTREEYVYQNFKDRQQLLHMHKKAKKEGLDLAKYNMLKEEAARIEYLLKKIRNPLKLRPAPKVTTTATPLILEAIPITTNGTGTTKILTMSKEAEAEKGDKTDKQSDK
ncbi:unnamed protein product [Acanthoscelides obtectus]|uniref:Calcium uniporter protein n=1 Tax=Acanthoscelides obtectus TaxID=200917 RepID=A0A9P0PI39_ACAOB|nr:unnamed protein product [Acanthoscelides obtectus]CAK1660652.1 Calcium uniporter protein, mitochondrial [Acanthoscelides obtectus]